MKILESQVRDYGLRIGGKPFDTGKYEYLGLAEEYIRDFSAMLRLTRQVSKAGGPAPEDAHRFYGRVGLADEAACQAAMEAADAASKAFASTPHELRKLMVIAIGQALNRHREELVWLGCCEGRPRSVFNFEFDSHYRPGGVFSPEVLDFYISQLHGEHLGPRDWVGYYPYGAVGFVPPGNAPIYNSVVGMMGAILAGNALVVKPPRNRPAQIMRMLEICDAVAAQFGFPGLFNTVVGDSRAIIEQWGDSPLVDCVVFYGGSGLGLEVGAMLTKKHTKAVLELSGSDPVVVWHDADLDKAALGIVYSRFIAGSGMVCVSPKRLLVHRAVYEPLIHRIVQLVSIPWAVGLPDEIEDGAPLLLPIMEMDRRLCATAIEDAQRKGKPILTGGQWMDHTGAFDPDGPFLHPTLIGEATEDLHCMQHEIFGPILPVMPVDSVEEALRVANDSIYGLRASVWTRDPGIGSFFSQRLQAGSVYLNEQPLFFEGRAPYLGGVKASGFTGAKYFHLELSIRRYLHQGADDPRQRAAQA